MTNRFVRSLHSYSLLSFPALAADQVVLTNGDTITGAIVKKDGATLTIKSEFLGVVTMPWSAVKSLRSDAELNVVLPAGQTVKGKLSTTRRPVADCRRRRDQDGASRRRRHRARCRGAAQLRTPASIPRILELWNGNFDLGLALANGNARSDSLTTAFTANRRTRQGVHHALLQSDPQHGARRQREQHHRQRRARRLEVQPQRLARACS